MNSTTRSRLKLLSVLVLFLVIRFFIFVPYEISGPSMLPYVRTGSRVVVNVLNHTPNRGDVVIIDGPQIMEGSHITLIKRVIALAGDVVRIHEGQVYVNGVRSTVDEYVSFLSINLTENIITMVPPGCIYVLGDNRINSTDSRVFGPVPVTAIEGVVLFRLWR